MAEVEALARVGVSEDVLNEGGAMSEERERLVTDAYNVVTGDGGVATPEETLDALNGLWDAALAQESPVPAISRADLQRAVLVGIGRYSERGGYFVDHVTDAVAEYLRGER